MVANVRKRVTSSEVGEISFSADCPSALSVEDIVYITGPEVSGIAQVDIVDITNVNTMPAIGIITEKTSSTRCKVVLVGEITTTSTLTPGKRYFVGATGTLSSTIPAPGVGAIAFAQPVGYALAVNRLIFNPESTPIIQKG